jgi:hypothetical protein
MKLKDFLSNTQYDDIPNNNLISEAGLSRLLKKYYEGNDFVIITAHRNKFDKKTNIKCNRELRSIFNNKKMGVYQLVGHWRECQDENIPYDKCPPEKLVDSIERSYMVIRPENISQDDFINLIKDLTKKFQQDASLISLDGKISAVLQNGKLSKVGDKLSLGKIGQAYSQYVKKLNVPFTFEGVEVPSCNSGRMIMTENNIKYPVLSKEEYQITKEWNEII